MVRHALAGNAAPAIGARRPFEPGGVYMRIFSHLRAAIGPPPLLLVSSFALACAVDSTSPPRALLQPRLDVTVAAPEFPNVVRFQDQFVFAIADPETDLFAIAGLPDDPTQEIGCGGSEPYAIVDFQFVGQDVIRALAKGDDVNLDVYRRSTFVSSCVSTPIAEGIGRVVYVDNDAFITGVGGNSWGFNMEGDVTLVGGGRAHLLAHNRFQILPDGTFRRVFRQVRLN
jgi:hypothetical protein